MNLTLNKVAWDNAYLGYFRFNNLRTLSTDLTSQLQVLDSNESRSFIDPTRRYDNQIHLQAAISETETCRLLEQYSPEQAPFWVLEPGATNNSLSRVLTKHSYHPSYCHEFMVMDLNLYNSNIAHPEITIERWGHERVDEFIELLKSSGVQCDEARWQQKRRYYCTENFRCFVALVDNQPCAWATSFIQDNTAILANAYTQQSHRNRGCQSALLQSRLSDAKTLGVICALSDVLPDTTSARNCKRVGFETYTIRTVWEKSS